MVIGFCLEHTCFICYMYILYEIKWLETKLLIVFENIIFIANFTRHIDDINDKASNYAPIWMPSSVCSIPSRRFKLVIWHPSMKGKQNWKLELLWKMTSSISVRYVMQYSSMKSFPILAQMDWTAYPFRYFAIACKTGLVIS